MSAVARNLGLLPARALTLTIAGTNGKGSSATLAAGILRESGRKVGLYTSPHLLHYRERIAIDGVAVDDDALVAAFVAIEAARGDTGLTYFEFGTLAALWLFARAGVDVQVLEVGLGGRLDAVNIVDADAALVTNIGLDHLDWLGPDREAIGREKAGVFRAGRPAVVAERDPPVSVLRELEAIGAHRIALGRDYDYDCAAVHTWSWHSAAQRLDDLPFPALAGAAQLGNAAGVLALLTSPGERLPVTAAAIAAGLRSLRLRGRFERRGRWIFDVAHNAESARVLADNLAAARLPALPRLVLGMLNDKPVEAVLEILRPQVAAFDFVSLPGARGLAAEALAARAQRLGIDGRCHASPAAAVREYGRTPADESAIVVCGSFLTVAEALQTYESEPDR